MAVTNFIQTIWSKKIQDDLELKTKLVQNCLRAYEGDCKYAQSVKILGVGEPTIGAYTGAEISIEEMERKLIEYLKDKTDLLDILNGYPKIHVFQNA